MWILLVIAVCTLLHIPINGTTKYTVFCVMDLIAMIVVFYELQ